MNAAMTAALQRCRDTYVGPGPCYLPDYLAARRHYHRLAVKLGLLDRKPTPVK